MPPAAFTRNLKDGTRLALTFADAVSAVTRGQAQVAVRRLKCAAIFTRAVTGKNGDRWLMVISDRTAADHVVEIFDVAGIAFASVSRAAP